MAMWNSGAARDLLILRHPLPHLDYVEYSRDYSGPPAYKFEVRHMNALVKKESDLEGRPFRLQNSEYRAQLRCRVCFSYVRLSLAVSCPSSSGGPVQLPVQLAAVITHCDASDNLVLTCDIKNERCFDRFYTFCNFTYVDKMRNERNALFIDVYAQLGFLTIPNADRLRWKVDFSNTDFMDNLGVTPIFYSGTHGPNNFLSNSLPVQIRLFVEGGERRVAAEFRFLNENVDRSECNTQFTVKLILINPAEQRENIVYLFNFHEWFKPEEWNAVEFQYEISTVREICNVKQLLPFLINNKLMVKVKLIDDRNVPA